MSFLTPLYLLGVLTVLLPVVFHMIRRVPLERREFSSIMFLEPSPPRTTSRSSIEHWLLLLIRATAVSLLAFAFARPFLRLRDDHAVVSNEFQEVALLLDTSASMRREGVWQEALQRAEQITANLEPADRLEVLAFDRRPRVLLSFEQWQSMSPSQRVEAAKQSIEELSPSWAATDLGRALIEAAERLDDGAEDEGASVLRTIVVVSDLQKGSQIESLQSYQWPRRMNVIFERVGGDLSPNNAAPHPILGPEEASFTTHVDVRVSNAAGADRQQFSLQWRVDSLPDREALSVSVPPGKSRVVSVSPPEVVGEAMHLVLEGDDHSFDNSCFVSSSHKRHLNLVLFTADTADNTDGMRYYLERALAETPDRTVRIQVDENDGQRLFGPDIDLMIITSSLDGDRLEQVRQYVTDGGTVMVVPASHDEMRILFSLLEVAAAGTEEIPVEATVNDYVMLTNIDFTHPLFSALNQPQYSDFTKVRFWKHRQLSDDSLPDLRVLARFDDGAIAAGETAIGEGHVVFLTAGWHPADSQLALSTKFVPMINGLLEHAAGTVRQQAPYVIGDEVDLTQLVPEGHLAVSVLTPAGGEVIVPHGAERFFNTDVPGRYRVLTEASGVASPPEFVVNLAASESETAPLSTDVLQAMDVPLKQDNDSKPGSAEIRRQMHSRELEQQQNLWRWLILVAVLMLMTETVIAARLARNPP